MTANVFQRCEKKYIMDQAQYKELKSSLANKTYKDQYGKYTVCNLYLDTEDFRLIRSSIEKPLYKEKIRLRGYGVPQQNDMVYLEVKKKFDGVVFKRRAPIRLSQAEKFLCEGMLPEEDGQIISEIAWSLNFYGHPVPKVYIAYDRIALCGLEDQGFRITFDTNIRWRDEALSLSKGAWGKPLLEEGLVLMEIKTLGAMPLWLSRELSLLKIFPTAYSKYGNCYIEYLSNSVTLGKGELISA